MSVRPSGVPCVLTVAALFLGSCWIKGSHDANEWINAIEKGMTKEEVEASKPDHVTIHWDHPVVDSASTAVEYDVTYEDRTDFFITPYYLVFVDGRYEGYSGRN